MSRIPVMLCAAAALLVVSVLPGQAKVTITETPEGTVLEITGEPGTAGGGFQNAPDSFEAGGSALSATAGSDPSGRTASIDEEIRRLERERDFLLIRTGTETPEESLQKRRMANQKFQEVNRLTAERLQLRFGGEGVGGR